jgi:hypothetical protein
LPEPGRRLHFLLGNCATHWRDIAALDERDIESAPQRFVGGRNSWIAQTYVRLRGALIARGWTVTVGPDFAAGAIVVAHRDDADRFLAPASASFLVIVRADRAPVAACDVAIVQNALAPLAHERFIPLWPQPGLIARARERCNRIDTIAYHGRHPAPWFADAELARALVRRRIRFEIRRRSWHDYSAVDLAIAARRDVPAVLATKPATKLYNAWLAGVPVLASAEPAYREQRRGPLDFLEVDGPGDVIRAIDLLRANPRLYAAMAEHGAWRAREFSVQATRDRWLGLLEDDVVPRYEATRTALAARRAWYLAAMARQKAASRMHKARAALERLGTRGDGMAPLGERAPDHFADVAGQAR